MTNTTQNLKKIYTSSVASYQDRAKPKFDQRIGLLFSLPKFLNSESHAIWSYNSFSPFFEVVLQEYQEQSKFQAVLDWTLI